MHYCDSVHLGGHRKYVVRVPEAQKFHAGPPGGRKKSRNFISSSIVQKNPIIFGSIRFPKGAFVFAIFTFIPFYIEQGTKRRLDTTFKEYLMNESSNAKTVHLVYLLTLNSRDFTASPNRIFRFQSNADGRREQNIFSMAALIWPMLFAQFGKKLFNLNSSI